MSLLDRTVLITGATGGLGEAMARGFAARGARLLLSGRRIEILQPLAGELGAQAIPCDLADREQVSALAEAAADVDVLVANAAMPAAGHVLELTGAQVDRILEVNLRAPIALAHALAPRMAGRRRGHLVFVASLNAMAATPRTAMYCASKFGLRGFALAAREDLRPEGVGVSVVYPGFVSEAGMFVDSNVKLPFYVGTRTPADVTEAVLSAIDGDRAEVMVAPPLLRLSTLFASLAPEAASWFARRFGSDKISLAFAEGQAEKLARDDGR